MGVNVLCERDEYEVLTSFLEALSVLLQDSDDREAKEKIQEGLRKIKEISTYVVLGEEGVGKTSLLRVLFKDVFTVDDDMFGDICEYRWGEQDFVTPMKDGVQKKFVSSDNMRGIAVVDTKGINRMGETVLAKLKEMANGSDAVFAVFALDNIRSPQMWNIIERMPKKQIVCFLTKCDAVAAEDLNKNLQKMRDYMREAGIAVPVFMVSMKEDGMYPCMAEMEKVRSFIRKSIIGENPMLKKQQENIEEIKNMLVQLRKSFALRKEQYESDADILQKINTSLDSYVLNHKQVISKFTDRLAADIEEVFDKYEQEIISVMDRRRFHDKNEFIKHLEGENADCQEEMTDSVNKRMRAVMNECLDDLEIVFQEAVGYFNERENILELKDSFYGSIASSRAAIAKETKEAAVRAGEFYRTLRGASEEMFLQIWNEWKKYDNKIMARKTVSTVAGAGAGVTVGAVGAGALSTFVKGGVQSAGEIVSAQGMSTFFNVAAKLTCSVVGKVALVGMCGTCMIVGAVAVNAIAKKLYDPWAAAGMEKNVQECIQQFRTEVAKNRSIMTVQMTEQVAEMFEGELAKIDACFTEFRISVNVEGEKLPLLQQTLETVGDMEERIRKIEGA